MPTKLILYDANRLQRKDNTINTTNSNKALGINHGRVRKV